MNVLVNCEESGVVREEFAKRGHNAWSCDILPTLIPGKHLQMDAKDAINYMSWDIMIAHPPCTFLTVANTHMKRGCKKYTAEQAVVLQNQAADFFMELVNCGIPKIGTENPIGVMSTRYRKPDQIIRPFMFGENSTKATCLWLKNLPLLQPTKIIEPEKYTSKTGKVYDKWWFDSSLIRDLEERARFRSKTFLGIAVAMAEQWG